MDIGHGETDEFGSLTSLPQNPSLVSILNTPVRTVPLIPEDNPCVCSLREADQTQANTYTSSPLQHYDIPRRFLQHKQEPFSTGVVHDRASECGSEGVPADAIIRQTVPRRLNCYGVEAAPPEGPTTTRLQPIICPDCGGQKVISNSFSC